jgi:thymidylate kinase
MKNKYVIILRGVSGSGKSTAAKLFGGNVKICCADDFFTSEEGDYRFEPSRLPEAHEYCRNIFLAALKDEQVDTIVVANTNSKENEFSFYDEKAKEIGAKVFYFVIENRHGHTDIHNVPIDAKSRQLNNIINSLKLI